MNDNIKRLYPDACKQWAEFSSRAVTTFRDAYLFFDEKQIVVTPTFMQGEAKPWGYEVQGKTRFMREQANYPDRISAEQAGFEQAFSELQKLILAGNA